MIIYTQTLRSALYDAIEVRAEAEKSMGYTADSAYLTTIKQLQQQLATYNEEYTEII